MAFPDEDIKIYAGDDQAPEGQLGEAEESAASYVAHKENGNLAKTRELGELLAQTLVTDSQRLQGDTYYRQKLAMLSFLVTDELNAGLSDGMLQQSAAASFRKRVELLSPEIFAIITDSTAFTLYILNDRQSGDERCGEVLAELCDRDNDPQIVAQGNTLAAEYRVLFAGIIGSYSFR